MSHEEAVRTNAAVRYAEGHGMSNTEKESFEEHFFACPMCAEAVQDADYAIAMRAASASIRRSENDRSGILPFIIIGALALIGIIVLLLKALIFL